MARRSNKIVSNSSAKKATSKGQYDYCSLPLVPERVLSPDVNPDRARLILLFGNKWANGTILHYYFFDKPTDGETVRFSDGTTQWVPWTTTEAEKNVVRQAFKAWKGVGIGLEFEEVDTRDEAEVRIGFMRGDGAWSYIGRTILDIGRDDRTMNFGWDLTRTPDEIDTAIHEIGHTLGFPHEHQNPNAGIVWNEEAVYTALAKPPNSWSREKTFYNIIRKIEPDTVQGSNWDPNSIMHYPFSAGLIDKPEQYRTGLMPAGNLSDRDKVWVKTFYPSLGGNDYVPLTPFQSVTLSIATGQQRNFLVEPQATRNYEFRTFGESDTVMVFFEDINGKLRYRIGDDDSGEDRNASFRVKLFKGKKYVLRVRLYYSDKAGETAVMMW
jgi:Astacin (Peptidase family M12A)